jgi:hypothetical protein
VVFQLCASSHNSDYLFQVILNLLSSLKKVDADLKCVLYIGPYKCDLHLGNCKVTFGFCMLSQNGDHWCQFFSSIKIMEQTHDVDLSYLTLKYNLDIRDIDLIVGLCKLFHNGDHYFVPRYFKKFCFM